MIKTIKHQDPLRHVFWPAFTDLVIGVFAVLVFTLMISIVQQTDQARQIEMQEEKIEEISRQNAKLEEDLQDAVNAGLISVKDGHIDITANILFPTGSSRINPEGKDLLKSLVPPLSRFISNNNDILMISGFTDDRPIKTRQFPSNWELSTARATEVVKQLTEFGFPRIPATSPDKETGELRSAGFPSDCPNRPAINHWTCNGKRNYMARGIFT